MMLLTLKNLLLLASLFLVTSTTFAEVHKWKDAEGKTHYGDVPETPGTDVIKIDRPSKDHKSNASRIRAETDRVLSAVAAENAQNEQIRRRQNLELRQQSERDKRDEGQRYRAIGRSR